MAPHLQNTESPEAYSRRERSAIAILTLGFIALSAVTHLALGSLYRPIPTPPEAVPQPHESATWGQLDRRPPRPTPTPQPVRIADAHAASHAVQGRHQPISRPPIVSGQGSPGPDNVSGSPGPASSPGSLDTAEPSTIPQPEASFAPCRMTRRIQPDYPDWVKQAGIQGTAVVIVELGPNGEVLSAHVGDSSGNAALDQSALAAARASAYECPLNAGRGGSDLYQVIYTFRLE